jgi:hypothetical protein
MLVVVKKTKMTPDHAWVGGPGHWDHQDKSVDISVVFTWDKPAAERIAAEWRAHGKEVRVGGPAYDDRGGAFVANRFIASPVTITSRGCPKKCPWCYVPKREGNIRELPIVPGNIVQDNNLLACSRLHIERVMEMLRGQRAISLRGGLDADFMEDWHIEQIKSLRLFDAWMAYDCTKPKTLPWIEKMSAAIGRNKLRVFVLVGFGEETMEQAEARLMQVWNAGGLPFAQLYDMRTFQGIADYKAWANFVRAWSRPAITKSLAKAGEQGK